MLVIWLLLVYVTSAEKCEVHPQNGKVIKPLVSVENGAKFLAFSRLDDPAKCHQGCCSSAKCDASFHTGSRLDSKGDNCFYFHCGDKCITDTDSNTEFSISMVTRISESAELPDFSFLVTNSTDDAVNEVDDPKSACLLPTIANGVVTPDTATVEIGDQYLVTCADHFTLTGNAAMMCQDDNVFDQTPTCQASVVETPPQDTSSIVETPPKDATSPPEPAEPTTEQTEKVTVKDHADIPDTQTEEDDSQEDVQPEPVETKPSPSEPAEPKVTLPNEVPPVKVTSAPEKDKETEEEEEEEETTKEEVAEDNNVYENEEPDVKSELKVEVDIHDVHEDSSAYTQKDVIFWLAVVGGSCLILFGLGTIVRVYRNKSRRLYASLTDDYLINGMYSI